MPALAIRAGALVDAAGRSLCLIGLHGGPLVPAAALFDGPFMAVPAGRRCVVWNLQTVADLTPAALARLDAAVAAHAAAGAYTLLRVAARLWLHGHQVALARRHAGNPAVLFALTGRAELAVRLAHAVLALREAHPTACVWLPLESARTAFATWPDPCVGLLWDAARPQHPGRHMGSGLRAPVMLDGWWPDALHPMADERLMRLCRQGGMGWLARPRAPGLSLAVVPMRTALALQRAVGLSLQDDPRALALPQAA